MMPSRHKSGRSHLLCDAIWTLMDDQGSSRHRGDGRAVAARRRRSGIVSCSASSPRRVRVEFKEELNIAQNQVTKLEEQLRVAEKEAEDLLSLSAKLARKGSENAQLIKKLNGKVTTLGSLLKALGSQLEEADSS
ncbi:hypothetical protein R1sor_020860 [Riccia sorocarpa]|uniref:Uncharacterized protein n=1 Tax=Riccia sorocarpa TaxID=122646 RepID=A0ABD3GJL7_9MARC